MGRRCGVRTTARARASGVSTYAMPAPRPASTGSLLRAAAGASPAHAGLVWAPPDARIGAQGEVQLRLATPMIGYLGDPRATAEAFTRDGWLRTGDLGRLDPDGYLTITGRLKERIIRRRGDDLATGRRGGAARAPAGDRGGRRRARASIRRRTRRRPGRAGARHRAERAGPARPLRPGSSRRRPCRIASTSSTICRVPVSASSGVARSVPACAHTSEFATGGHPPPQRFRAAEYARRQRRRRRA